jgi:type I restriction enzyme S subunit
MDRSKWEYKKLNEVSMITMGQSPSSDSYNEEGIGLPFYQGNADFGVLHPKVRVYCDTPQREANANDILMSVRAPIGAINIADAHCCIGRGLCAICPKKGTLDLMYLYYFLISKNDYLNQQGTGSTFKSIGKKTIFDLSIPVPSVEDQQIISGEINCLNEMITLKQEQLKEFDKLAQTIFYDMFANKGWEYCKIKDIATVKIGPFGSSLHVYDYITGGTPLVNPIHMINGTIVADNDFTISEEKKEELSSYLLKTYDIVFGRRGDIGRCALVTSKENGFLCGTGSMFIRFNKDINPIYALRVLSSNEVRKYLIYNAKGATMLNINGGIVENISIPLPPLALQQQFAEKISAIEAQKELVKQSIAETQALLDYTMDKYFGYD